MDENYLQFCTDYKKFIKDKTFVLHNQSDHLIPFDNYISYFFKERGVMDFFMYSPHNFYEVDVLDQFKGKFVYTSFLANPDGTKALNSLIQQSRDTHLLVNYPYREEKFFCNFLVYTRNVPDYLNFLTNNEKYEYRKVKKIGY